MRNQACCLSTGFLGIKRVFMGCSNGIRNLIVLGFLGILFVGPMGSAQTLPGVGVAWNANSEPDLAGYYIYYGTQSLLYTNRVTVGKVTTGRVEGLVAGVMYYFALTAFNTGGIESLPSAEVTYRVPNLTNLPPTLNALADVVVDEDSGLRAVYLSGISAGGTESQALVVTATSSNPPLIPVPRIYYTSPDTYGWLVYSVAPNLSGASAISVTVDDGQAANHTFTRSFVINVAPKNDPPAITALPNQILREDTVGLPVSFTLSDLESPPSALSVSARSSNPVLIPDSYVLLGGTEAERELLIVPQSDQSGTADITLAVRDPHGAVSSVTFSVRVDAVNDEPVVFPIADQVISEDTASGALAFYIFDAETPPDELGILIQSSNLQLISDTDIIITGTGNSRSLSFTPLKDQYGSGLIQLFVYDTEGSYSEMHFEVLVLPGNDAPTITPVGNLVLNEDTPSGLLQVTVGDLETAAGDLMLNATSSNPLLVEDKDISFGGAQGQRTFAISSKRNQFGAAVVHLIVTDLNGDSTSTSFTLTVNPVNDAPGIDPIPGLSLEEGSGSLTVPLFGIHSGAANEAQPLTVTAVSNRPDIVPQPRVDYLSPNPFGSVVIAPLPQTDGTAVITVSVNDGQAINSVTTQSFTVVLRSFNNPPVISSLPDLAVVRIPNAEVITFSVQDPDTTANNLVVTGYSSDLLLLPNANLTFGGTGTQRTLTVRPVLGRTGLAVVTIVASDGDATVSTSFYVLVTLTGV